MKTNITTLTLAMFLFLGTVFVDAIGYNSYDVKRVILLLLVMLLSCYCVFDSEFKMPVFNVQVAMPVLLFFLLGILSSALGPYPFWGIVDVVNYATLVSLFLLLLSYFSRMKSIDIIRRSFFWISLYTAFYFYEFLLGVYFTSLVGIPLDRLVAAVDYSHPRFFNQLQVIIIPFLLAPFFIVELEKYKWLARCCLSKRCELVFNGCKCIVCCLFAS